MKQEVLFQRAEGLTVLVVSLIAYASLNFSWLQFVVLLLTVDLSMLGYLINSKIGAYLYNFGHSLIAPLSFLAIGYYAEISTILMLSLIWTAHIGMDRLFGYGLKLESGFKETHLGRIGGD